MRLDRFLSGQNVASRKQIKELVRAGLVSVNGKVASDPSINVKEASDCVSVRGEEIVYKKYLYVMLNKPKGVICATDDKRHQTVLDLLPESLKRKNMFPAGRLDIDTEGFVLLTDDGDFAHRMLSPKHHVPKTYHAVLAHPIAPEEIRRYCDGIVLKDGTKCLPAQLRVLEDREHPLVSTVLYEGKFHQVKRMFEAVDNHVEALKRVSIGGLSLDPELAPGQAREILHKECELILGTNLPENE